MTIARSVVERHLLEPDLSTLFANPEQRGLAKESRSEHLTRVCAAIDAQDWRSLFPLLGHAGRGAALVLLSDRMDAATLNRILAEWWNATEGVRPREAIPLFRRAGYVTDDATATPPTETGNLTIYRGVRIPRHRLGISWTLDLERARFFAGRYTAGGGYVYVAELPPDGLLGYFTDRNEREVVVDPGTLRKIKRLSS